MVSAAKGPISAGEVIEVEQTGGIYKRTRALENQLHSQAPLPSAAPSGLQPLPPASIAPFVLLELEGDPLFRVGEEVALGLRAIPDSERYVLVGPQGRFTVLADRTVRPILDDDGVVAPLDGVSMDELADRVAEMRGN